MVHVFSFVYGDFEADLRLLSKNNLLKVGLEKGGLFMPLNEHDKKHWGRR
jgi:hypothetical protein